MSDATFRQLVYRLSEKRTGFVSRRSDGGGALRTHATELGFGDVPTTVGAGNETSVCCGAVEWLAPRRPCASISETRPQGTACAEFRRCHGGHPDTGRYARIRPEQADLRGGRFRSWFMTLLPAIARVAGGTATEVVMAGSYVSGGLSSVLSEQEER